MDPKPGNRKEPEILYTDLMEGIGSYSTSQSEETGVGSLEMHCFGTAGMPI
jgi:hypothetical protein